MSTTSPIGPALDRLDPRRLCRRAPERRVKPVFASGDRGARDGEEAHPVRGGADETEWARPRVGLRPGSHCDARREPERRAVALHPLEGARVELEIDARGGCAAVEEARDEAAPVAAGRALDVDELVDRLELRERPRLDSARGRVPGRVDRPLRDVDAEAAQVGGEPGEHCVVARGDAPARTPRTALEGPRRRASHRPVQPEAASAERHPGDVAGAVVLVPTGALVPTAALVAARSLRGARSLRNRQGA